MRIARSTLIGTAVAMALFGRHGLVQAQQQPAANQLPPTGEPLQEVVVTGIRASLQQSIEMKKDADTFIDVVTADDIGKMPDKNVADALMRVPGVTVSSAGANEGGFDEQDRVSMRGTNPSLTQTLINGHNVASADWFVLNQTGTVGRSVSYTLLPSELVQQVVVEKSSQASLVEGGVAGSINIITRKALDFHQNQLEISAGAVYADLPAKWSPQVSALGAWVNDSHNFGVMLQLFSETRELRRDGQELLGYSTISPTSATAIAHPDLAGVSYPVLMGSALFQQKRQRNGGMLDVEFQPSDNLTIDATGFLSKLNATNVNDNYLMWLQNGFFHDGNGQVPDNYTIQNNTMTSASWSAVPGTNYGIYDQISRPNEVAETNFGNLDIDWRASDKLKFYAQGGVSTAHGKTPFQDVLETVPGVGNGATYTLNGTGTAPNWNLGSTNGGTPNPINPVTGVATPVPFGWIFGDQNTDVLDKEWWTRLDGTYNFNAGMFKDLEFGVRYSEHQRHSWNVIGQGPNFAALGPNPSNTYPSGYGNYPSNYGNGLGTGFPTNIWNWTPEQLSAYDAAYANRDPVSRADWTSDYGLQEKTPSAYLEATFGGDSWAGNIGVRYVQTKEDIINNVSTSATNPEAITTSAFGPYVQVPTNNTYDNVLPTANLKINLSPELIARFAAGETMTRADYSALAGAIQLGAPPPPCTTPPNCIIGSGSGSNPNLKPITSWNYDAGLEWYFAKRSLLDFDVFYMDLKNYVGFGTVRENFLTFSNLGPPEGYEAPYDLTVPVNASGRVYGFEANYIQAIGDHFGVETNYTYSDGKQTSLVTNGDDRLVGTSKNTFNIMGYYENAHFSARIAYNYRSEFFSGLDRNTAFSQGSLGTLAASLVWTVNDNFSVTVDGMNLNNPTLKYFAQNDSQPRAFYKNGAQYYLTLRFKM
jgi:iron complex outermembrane receptor protein